MALEKKVPVDPTAVGRKLYLGGGGGERGGMTKKILSSGIIFLGYKKAIFGKVGGTCPQPPPPGSYSTGHRAS